MTHTLSRSEQLTHCTVRIVTESSYGNGTGTGFFYRFVSDGIEGVQTIVTNKHVVENATKATFYVHLTGQDGNPDYINHEVIELHDLNKRCFFHPDPSIDLCAIAFSDILNQKKQEKKELFMLSVDSSFIPSTEELEDFSAIEDVIMIGYPNGIWDETNNMPVLRRGTTATHPKLDWNGNPEFLVDIACFPGSSGSPVFLFNMGGYFLKSQPFVIQNKIRIKLLGVLYAGFQHTVTGEIQVNPIPTINKPIAVTQIPNNLGMIIKSHNLNQMDALIRTTLHMNKG